MALFPLFANLSGREVLVIGGGEVATRKIDALLQAGARVEVHAHALNETLQQWLDEGRLRRREGTFDPDWIDQAWLLIAATDDHAFNQRLADEAGRRKRLANIVDDATLSSFQIPALVDRAPLQVAISSGGAAPMLARRLRERLESQLDPSLGELAALFERHRDAVRQALPQLAQRRRWFDQVLDGPVPGLLERGESEQAEQAFREALQHSDAVSRSGMVLLVGTGGGDAGQLTLRALRALNQADVLLYGPDVAAPVLVLARRDAPRRPLPADAEQQWQLLLRHVEAGDCVVCLQPGDAYRNAPGDRLAQRLAEHGIAHEVIAGLPA
ncbi:NAD(P)-dependent oxidoreductase [Lysobacter sp. ESA13C]|uniref:siroheme synthase n=1 Tax=Lysobacter sp. ESA13C TaxID=2862676 RepID=UPI001CBFEBBB|nr:NAD(P)-dependent oxidoreductase [Lysobacter sp. ESA13C]